MTVSESGEGGGEHGGEGSEGRAGSIGKGTVQVIGGCVELLARCRISSADVDRIRHAMLSAVDLRFQPLL